MASDNEPIRFRRVYMGPRQTHKGGRRDTLSKTVVSLDAVPAPVVRILAFEDVSALTVHQRDGSVITYSTWEAK